MNEENKPKTIEDIVEDLSHDKLKEKFVSLYKKYETITKNKTLKITENVSNDTENLLDFTNHKIKRRQQYLHKTYTKNATALNFLLSEMLNNNDKNLQAYFTNINKELENEATTNNDLPLTKIYE